MRSSWLWPVKHSTEDGGGRDFRLVAGIGQQVGSGAESEDFVQVAGEGRELVARPLFFLLSHKCKIAMPSTLPWASGLLFLSLPRPLPSQ